MALTADILVPQNTGMLGSELSYVRDQLARYKHADWKRISTASGVPFRTVKRIGYRETAYPRSDTVGKLAMYFRTQEKRGRA